VAAHAPVSNTGTRLPASLAKLCLTLLAAALIVVLGELMASQLPDSTPTPAVSPVAVYATAPSSQPSVATAPNALPSGPADLNGGSRGFPPESLTVNQRLP
jgi:hypothetical protein